MLNKGLDAGTAYEILSIDIADVDVGRNIGAQLQTDQAQADLRIARAKAEERRAMAVAKSRKWSRSSRRCAHAWSKPKPRSRKPWLLLSAKAIWA